MTGEASTSEGYSAEIFICPTVNVPDENGLGGHAHLFQCNDCQKFVQYADLDDCPRHDHIAALVDEQLANTPAPAHVTTTCHLCGTSWDAETAQCPNGCAWESEAETSTNPTNIRSHAG